jgi:hypothetical protein
MKELKGKSRIQKKVVSVPRQKTEARKQNFDEVVLRYTEEEV